MLVNCFLKCSFEYCLKCSLVVHRPPQSAQSTRFSCWHVFGLPGTIAKIVIWSVQWYIGWKKTDNYRRSRYRKAWKQQSLTLKVAWDKVEGCFLLQANKRSENSCRHHFPLWRPGCTCNAFFLLSDHWGLAKWYLSILRLYCKYLFFCRLNLSISGGALSVPAFLIALCRFSWVKSGQITIYKKNSNLKILLSFWDLALNFCIWSQ